MTLTELLADIRRTARILKIASEQVSPFKEYDEYDVKGMLLAREYYRRRTDPVTVLALCELVEMWSEIAKHHLVLSENGPLHQRLQREAEILERLATSTPDNP